MRILHACKSTNNGKFHDIPEKDAGGGRETGNLFGVALPETVSAVCSSKGRIFIMFLQQDKNIIEH